jgi:hypothetical protein
MIEPEILSRIYKQYGFEHAKCKEPGIQVFTLRSGHFHNADIIKVTPQGDEEKVFQEFKKAGYACKIRAYSNTQEIEKSLFKGFFSVEATKIRLEKEYEKHANTIAKAHSDTGTYSYINSKYSINDRTGETGPVEEIYSRLSSTKPTLFLVEAAAGFGKTCTAFELLKKIITETNDKIPLFSELSRNRQAKIFRYVLLDEIDRSFPLLSSSLVRSEIQNGNVPVILDGFDELLHQTERDGEANGYDSTEPMLETIGELLKKSAKVILTTRRTAIFDGDDFHSWVESHNDDFDIFRIRISEPTINEWIPPHRLDALERLRFPIERLNNPVLLSYLRCISDTEFRAAIDNPDAIVEKYFNSMLERERKRQDLRMIPTEQYEVLKFIARDMVAFNYTSESREYLSELILEHNKDCLDKTRKQYPPDERPTLDELVAKLASHALLDRSSETEQGIGFVNEFVLGNFCAEIIIEDEQHEWVGDNRFIEPAVISTTPRSGDRKKELWDALRFVSEFLSATDKAFYTLKLTNGLNITLESDSIEQLEIESVLLGSAAVKDFIFINCSFSNVTIDLSNLENVTFVNCRFFDCTLTNMENRGNVYSLGCNGDDAFLADLATRIGGDTDTESEEISPAEIFVLEKYWPKGRPTFMKHRPIKGICISNNYSQGEILQAIQSLRKKKYLIQADKFSFLELNIDHIPQIKLILGRA